eukprot:PITA_08257
MSTLKWMTLFAALLLLLEWGTPTVDAHEDIVMDGDQVVQQQGLPVCLPGLLAWKLSACRDYLQRRREQPSERCCEELQRMSPHCRCRAIERALDQSQSYDSSTDSDSQDGAPLNQRRRRRGEGRGREEEEEEAVERAEELPDRCNVRESPRRCDIRRHSRYSIIGGSS